MNREDAKRIVKDHLEDYLRSVHGIDTRKPFKCLNPAHNDHNPSMGIDKDSKSGLHAHCFTCGAYYDTFDLIALDRGVSQSEAFEIGFQMYGLQPEGFTYRQSAASAFGKAIEWDGVIGENRKQAKIEQNTQSALHNTQYTIPNTQQPEEPAAPLLLNIDGEIEAAHKALLSSPEAMKHYTDRGISAALIERYKLGYSAGGYNALLKAYPDHQSQSRKAHLYTYVLPYLDEAGRYTYFTSEIADRKQTDEYNKKYRKITKGDSGLAAPIFNERYLKKDAPPVIFICEGIYDALSVEEAGYKAIAFVGTAHRRFLELCKYYQPKTTFVISLDNDTAGEKAIKAVKEGLKELGLHYITRVAEEAKDFNEALTNDRAAFTSFIQKAAADTANAEAEELEEEQRELREAQEEYQSTTIGSRLQEFIDSIEKSKTAIYYPTGFTALDELLDGGLYAGLYIMGAISSLGKTTFCLQLLDNIAAAGNDVLIFSLEMSWKELAAKSVSRHSYIEAMKTYKSKNSAKSTRGILTGSRYINYSQRDRETIKAAIERYNDYAGNIRIFEGVADISVAEIEEKVRNHIKLTGRKPVIMIDYIQILAASDKHMTDKQKTDENVTALKRLSRDLDIPVLGISSFNRDNYREPVSMASFKESGAVEYSSDVLIGLQYNGMDYRKGEKEAARNARIRELMEAQPIIAKGGEAQDIQLKVLKNRNGSKGSTYFNYYPMFNYYAEREASDLDGWRAIDGDEKEPETVKKTTKKAEKSELVYRQTELEGIFKIERKEEPEEDEYPFE